MVAVSERRGSEAEEWRQDERRKLDYVQGILGYRFRDETLLEEALSHKSLDAQFCYQKLEWLGDSVLGLLVSEELYRRHGRDTRYRESDLTLARAALVNGKKLREISGQLRLADSLIAARGVSEVFNGKMLEDILEAIIGAVWADGGYVAASRIVVEMYTPEEWDDAINVQANPKTELQELAAQCGLGTPCYELVATDGPLNNQQFYTACHLTLLPAIETRGMATSKAGSEEQAAELLIHKIRALPDVQARPLNARSQLLELCTKYQFNHPEIEVVPVMEEASAHLPAFKCAVRVGELYVEAVAPNKKAAMREACFLMTLSLQDSLQHHGTPVTAKRSILCEPLGGTQPKAALLGYAVRMQHACPRFTLIDQKPPQFTVRCTYPEIGAVEEATAQNKKLAERLAAERVLSKWVTLEAPPKRSRSGSG